MQSSLPVWQASPQFSGVLEAFRGPALSPAASGTAGPAFGHQHTEEKGCGSAAPATVGCVLRDRRPVGSP